MVMKESAPNRKVRTTLQMVAKAAKVTTATASYALKNNPKISQKTRTRIHRIAKRLGYAPDPEISRLMHVLRTGRGVAKSTSIALLSFAAESRPEQNQYFLTLLDGVRQRAGEVGHTIDSISVDPKKIRSDRLTQILRSRGIQGILIPPFHHLIDCSGWIDWSQFSVIAATYSAQRLSVNRVVPNYLQNSIHALGRLHNSGFKRVGLITEEGDHERVNYSYLAALAMYQRQGTFADIPDIQSTAKDELLKWYQKYRPDVLLTTERHQIRTLTSSIGPDQIMKSPIFNLNSSRDQELAGIYQHPEIVGRIAVDLLAGAIQRGERGYVEHSNVTMVEGSWVEPESCGVWGKMNFN